MSEYSSDFRLNISDWLCRDCDGCCVILILDCQKLIRSKGIGIYFITQNPQDIPDGVLSQLDNKIQHALHAYTPKEQKAAKTAAMSFRGNPAFDTYESLFQLGIGEALCGDDRSGFGL